MAAVRDELGLFDLVPLSVNAIAARLAIHSSDEIEEFTAEMFECEAVLPDASQRRAIVACLRAFERRGEPQLFQTAWETFLVASGVPADKAAGSALPGWLAEVAS